MYSNILDAIGLLRNYDDEIASATLKELNRQKNNLELIASENIVSPAVMAAMGSILTNKYAEGYPGKRYYGGCEFVDIVESLAINRAKKLFNANFANVQPHSGANANTAVYVALLKPGDTALGLGLNDGGHLTHGSKVNMSGKYYNFIPYGVNNETGLIDYNVLEDMAKKEKPKIIVTGASAYPRIIDFKTISQIAKGVGALLMVDIAHIAGLVCTGLHPSPMEYADVVTSTTHKTLRGPRGGLILSNDEDIAKKIDKAIFPGTQGGPLMHVIAGKAVCFKEALGEDFKVYQSNVLKNSKRLASALLAKGFSLISGGTDNHLILIDLRKFKITGKELEQRLDSVNITVNKNAIPNDPQEPFLTSGIRVGTPAITTRGLKEDDMDVVADCIYKISTDFDANKKECIEAVKRLTEKYPIY